MPYLLDTHIFLWMAAEPERLSSKVAAIVQDPQNALALSAATAWEIALLNELDRIELPDEPRRFIPEALQHFRVEPRPIGFQTTILAAMLPRHHRDPFDRIIIAEAMIDSMPILTSDKDFLDYAVQAIW